MNAAISELQPTHAGTVQPIADPSDEELEPGRQACGYLIERKIDSGGHGTVFAARRLPGGRPVALKVLHRALARSAEMLERFVREAQIVERIRHPNIVEVYDFGRLPDGRPYFAMELLEGTSLFAEIQEKGRFSPASTLAYMEPLCAALQAAHRCGVVHRDLKASNVVVLGEAGGARLKLLDFGIAKLTDPQPGAPGLTVAGQRLGTAHAMSPEQIRGESIDPRADVYALGVLLHQMLTGNYPFSSEDPIELERLHLEAPPPRPGAVAPVSSAMDEVVRRSLEKEKERRYPSVGAFLDALRDAVQEPSRSPPDPAGRRDPVIAVQVALGLSEKSEADDELLERMAALLDDCEIILREGGFVPSFAGGMVLIGARNLPADPVRAAVERRRAGDLLERLERFFLGPDGDPRVRPTILIEENGT